MLGLNAKLTDKFFLTFNSELEFYQEKLLLPEQLIAYSFNLGFFVILY
jgi:hypothetical protein